MTSLIERIESAEGPSRELDAEISALLLGRTGFKWLGHYYTCNQIVGACGGDEPHYTASIDAALTLVPEGWVFSVDTLDVRPEAVVGNDLRAIVRADYVAAVTPALALCAAALRARGEQA